MMRPKSSWADFVWSVHAGAGELCSFTESQHHGMLIIVSICFILSAPDLRSSHCCAAIIRALWYKASGLAMSTSS